MTRTTRWPDSTYARICRYIAVSIFSLSFIQPADSSDYVILSVSDNDLQELRLSLRGNLLLETSVASHRREDFDGLRFIRATDGRQLVELVSRHSVIQDCAVKTGRRQLRFFLEEFYSVANDYNRFNESQILDVYLGDRNISNYFMQSFNVFKLYDESKGGVSRGYTTLPTNNFDDGTAYHLTTDSINTSDNSQRNDSHDKHLPDSRRRSNSHHVYKERVMTSNLSQENLGRSGFIEMFQSYLDVPEASRDCHLLYKQIRERLESSVMVVRENSSVGSSNNSQIYASAQRRNNKYKSYRDMPRQEELWLDKHRLTVRHGARQHRIHRRRGLLKQLRRISRSRSHDNNTQLYDLNDSKIEQSSDQPVSRSNSQDNNNHLYNLNDSQFEHLSTSHPVSGSRSYDQANKFYDIYDSRHERLSADSRTSITQHPVDVTIYPSTSSSSKTSQPSFHLDINRIANYGNLFSKNKTEESKTSIVDNKHERHAMQLSESVLGVDTEKSIAPVSTSSKHSTSSSSSLTSSSSPSFPLSSSSSLPSLAASITPSPRLSRSQNLGEELQMRDAANNAHHITSDRKTSSDTGISNNPDRISPFELQKGAPVSQTEFHHHQSPNITRSGSDLGHSDGATTLLRSRVKRDILSGWMIMPGTKWCGDGDIAEHKKDLGAKAQVDACCRRHDLCPHIITRLSWKYEIFNFRLHTVLHCRCDRKFRKCLERSSSPEAEIVGQLYFNMLSPPCFNLQEEQRCVTKMWWGGCREYGAKHVAKYKTQRRFKTRRERQKELRRKRRKGKIPWERTKEQMRRQKEREERRLKRKREREEKRKRERLRRKKEREDKKKSERLQKKSELKFESLESEEQSDESETV